MRQKNTLLIIQIIISLFVVSSSCSNKEPYKPDYKNITGYVIGKETCNSNENKDY